MLPSTTPIHSILSTTPRPGMPLSERCRCGELSGPPATPPLEIDFLLVRVPQHRDEGGLWNQLVQQTELFGHQISVGKNHAGEVAFGRVTLVTRPVLIGSKPLTKTSGRHR
jgi:hypothetical protein